MNKAGILQYEMLRRIRDYGAARPDSFPAASRAGQLFAALDLIVKEVETHGAAQVSSASASRKTTTSKAVARTALLKDMEAIHRTALAMALSIPGLDDKFKMPRTSGTQTVLTAARAFAKDALPLKAEFINRDLPESFLEDLASGITGFEKEISDSNRTIGSRVSARVSIHETLNRGMRVAKELNAIVKNKIGDNKAALAEWTTARHVERSQRSKSPKLGEAPATSDNDLGSGTHLSDSVPKTADS